MKLFKQQTNKKVHHLLLLPAVTQYIKFFLYNSALIQLQLHVLNKALFFVRQTQPYCFCCILLLLLSFLFLHKTNEKHSQHLKLLQNFEYFEYFFRNFHSKFLNFLRNAVSLKYFIILTLLFLYCFEWPKYKRKFQILFLAIVFLTNNVFFCKLFYVCIFHFD